MSLYTWNSANILWNDNPYTWNEVELVKKITQLAGERAGYDVWDVLNQTDQKKLIKLTLKVYGDTITESKQKEIKQYKMKASDIKLTVEKVLGVELMTENIKF
jgi:hypothetical protein